MWYKDMDNVALFSERQYFRQKWLWAVLLILNCMFVYGLYTQLFLERPFGDNPMSNAHLIFTTCLLLAVTLLFALLRLDTRITHDAVYYRFLPFEWRFKKVEWNRISKVYVTKYHPLLHFGGWGLRFSIFGKGWAYNVSGNMGLQLIYDNGKKFLIGTQKPEELKTVLQQLNRYTE